VIESFKAVIREQDEVARAMNTELDAARKDASEARDAAAAGGGGV